MPAINDEPFSFALSHRLSKAQLNRLVTTQGKRVQGEPNDLTDTEPLSVETPQRTDVPTQQLPCSRESAQESNPPPGILLVEDERRLRKALAAAFRHRGFQVWIAEEGGEAVEVFSQNWRQIDVVLSDVWMPIVDGPEMLQRLRELSPSLCVCFMTGDSRSSLQKQLLGAGANRVYIKPFSSVADLVHELWELAAPRIESEGRDTGQAREGQSTRSY